MKRYTCPNCGGSNYIELQDCIQYKITYLWDEKSHKYNEKTETIETIPDERNTMESEYSCYDCDRSFPENELS